MVNFLEYKIDDTIAILKIYSSLNIFEDNFNLKIEKGFIKKICKNSI